LLRCVALDGRHWLMLLLSSSQIDIHELTLLHSRQPCWRRGPDGGVRWLPAVASLCSR
jgi:hypothetical protein